MKNYYQKKLVQVFFILCLFIDINFFLVVQDLQAKETGSSYQEFDNFAYTNDSNYKYNHKYNYNLLAQTSYKNSYYPQNINHANYSLALPVLIKPEILILSVATMAASFFLYNSNLLQKAWLGNTLLNKTNQAVSNQTDHQTEFVSISSSSDNDHIKLQQNSHENPKPVFWQDDQIKDHKEDPSSFFSQSQKKPPNYESVIKQAVDEKGIDFIEHTTQKESDPRKYQYVRSQLDIKTLEYIYLLEKKYFELSQDMLKDLLKGYRPGDNYSLSVDKSQLLKALIDLQDRYALVYCHLFLSHILKLDYKKFTDILEMYDMKFKSLSFFSYRKKEVITFLKSQHLWQAQDNVIYKKRAHSVDNELVNRPAPIYPASNIGGNSEIINKYIDNLKKEFFNLSLDKRNELMSEYLKDNILTLENSHLLVFDHIKRRFDDFHLILFLNSMLNFNKKKITRSKILNLFNINHQLNLYYKAIYRVKKHLNTLHHYDLITFTSAESLDRFLDDEFKKIISDKDSDDFKKLLKKFNIDPDDQNNFIDVIVNFVKDLENQGAYKKPVFINFNVFEHSIHHNVFWDVFRDHEGNTYPSVFTSRARKTTLHKFKNTLHNIYRVFASKPQLFEFQNTEIKKLSDYELKLLSKTYKVKNYNKVVLSDKISSFFRQNAIDSDQDKIIFFSKVLSIPKIKDHHLTELLYIDQQTLLSVSDDLKSKWHKLYTLSDLSYKPLDDLNHIYESLTDSQWDEIFKNFNFSYSSNIDLFSKKDIRQMKNKFNDYYYYVLDNDFKKMVFLVMVLKLTHPTEYINDRLFKTYIQSSMKNTNASASGKRLAYTNKKTAVLSNFFKYLDLNIVLEYFASSQALEATINLRFESLTNKQWQDMAKANGVSDTKVLAFINEVTDYYKSLTNDIERALLICRVLGLCAVSRANIFQLYNQDDIEATNGSTIEIRIYNALKTRLSKIHD